jgi:hypothetical protein
VRFSGSHGCKYEDESLLWKTHCSLTEEHCISTRLHSAISEKAVIIFRLNCFFLLYNYRCHVVFTGLYKWIIFFLMKGQLELQIFNFSSSILQHYNKISKAVSKLSKFVAPKIFKIIPPIIYKQTFVLHLYSIPFSKWEWVNELLWQSIYMFFMSL